MARCIIIPEKCEQLVFIAEQMLTALKCCIEIGMVDCLFSLMTVETSAGQGIYANRKGRKIILPDIRVYLGLFEARTDDNSLITVWINPRFQKDVCKSIHLKRLLKENQ